MLKFLSTKLIVMLALSQVVIGTCPSLPTAFGRKFTQDTTTNPVSTVVSCESGFHSSGDISLTCVDGVWTGGDVESVICSPASCQNIVTNFGFGDCSSYHQTTGINFNYCKTDKQTVAGTTYYAYQVCEQCKLCGVAFASTPVPTPTPTLFATPTPVARTTSTAFKGYGECPCYEDSNLLCSEQGLCEILPSNPTRPTRSCAFLQLPNSNPAVYYDRCKSVSELECRDTFKNYVDKFGVNCPTYGVKYCTAENMKSKRTDTIGNGRTGTFNDYTNSDGFDPSEACCACGGGSKKCRTSDIHISIRLPWKFDYTSCDETYVGDNCTVSCFGNPSIFNSLTCDRTDPSSEAIITGAFPECSETFVGWQLSQSGAYCQPKTGSSAVTHLDTNWQQCTELASSNCQYYLSWDSSANKCVTYANAATDCTITSNSLSYIFNLPSSAPQHSPVLSCSIEQVTVGATIKDVMRVVSTDNRSCLNGQTVTLKVIENQNVETKVLSTGDNSLTYEIDAVSGSVTFQSLVSSTIDGQIFEGPSTSCTLTYQ